MCRLKTPYTLLILALLLASISSFAQTNATDSLALVDLYNNTNGSSWTNSTNWLTSQPVSTWYGITVTGGRVTSIKLTGNGLSGSIPSSFGNLAQLQYLEMDVNNLSGAIPASIGNLTNLTYLSIIENKLTGALPASIGNLSQLQWMRFSDNMLSGSLPASLGNLSSLQYFYMGDNQFTGSIPASLGNLTQLIYLQLYINQLTGSIPASLGNLPNLYDLELELNQLSGTIPASLSNLVSLQYLGLHHNQLTGPIPASLGILDLFFLAIQDNRFTFDGMELIGQKPITQKTYAPQATVPLHYQCSSKFWVSVGGTLANNTYTWFKNGQQVAQNVGDSTFTSTGTALYYVQVTNTLAPDLILHSDTISGGAIINNVSTTVCTGHAYTLPSGNQVGTTGNYKDTVRSTQGCDSLITLLSLTAISAARVSLNTALCGGQSYTLPSGTVVTAAGLYQDTLHTTSGCDSVIASVTITEDPLLTQIDGSVKKCMGTQTTLDAGSPGETYQWSSGQSGHAIVVTMPGTYIALATGVNGCTVRDTFTVSDYASAPLALDKHTALCAGQTRQLDAGNGYQTYAWNTGSAAQSIIVGDTGVYAVTVTDQYGCSQTDTAHISKMIVAPPLFLPADTNICQNSSLMLGVKGTFPDYLWSTGATASVIIIEDPGEYWVRVTDANGCAWTDTLQAGIQLHCTEGFFIPKAFTPNGDGHNDLLRPLVLNNETVLHYHFEVFNRWGQLVFKSENPAEGWDGRLNGEWQGSGVFAWLIEYQFVNRPARIDKGTVLLIR